MNHLRGNRVVIASLFLPETIALREPSDDQQPRRPAFGSNLTGLQSIVDDLKDKSSGAPTPNVSTAFPKLSNPFASPGETSNLSRSTSLSRHLRHMRSLSLRRDSRRPLNDKWIIESNSHCNGGLRNAIDSVGDKLSQKIWVGALGIDTDFFSSSLRAAIATELASPSAAHPCLPVWIPDAEFRSAYDEYCHQALWPCLHYAIPDPRHKSLSGSYSNYVAVNQYFADAIISNHRPGDIIWVNDYHLMLLPALLRSSCRISPSTPICFFMHVAFPSSEMFRCLAERNELLRGVLGADFVGFQTANYARHFRATVHRILAYEALPKGIMVADGSGAAGEDKARVVGADGVLGQNTRGRFVDVGVFPMGIDVSQLRRKKEENEVKDWIQLLKQRYVGMKVVVARDKLDPVQGVRFKLRSFEYFLEKYPSFQGKVILIQVALPTTSTSSLTALPESVAVTDVISRINSRYSTLTYQPVVFLQTQDLTFGQYLALLSVADAFMITSVREGMALRTHEFIECQEGRHRPLILSELTGSYDYFGHRSCIAINPWDTRGTADAINQALTMSDEEAQIRWADLHNRVRTQTAQTFVSTFLARCVRAHAENKASGADVPLLDGDELLTRYQRARRRLVLVDLEGTLWKRDLSQEGLACMEEDYKRSGEWNKNKKLESRAPDGEELNQSRDREGVEETTNTEIAVPSEVLDIIKNLVNDKCNEVWLLSGLRMQGILERISEQVPGLGIVAENGCFIKPALKEADVVTNSPTSAASLNILNEKIVSGSDIILGNGWVNMLSNVDLSWKGSCLEMLNYFTERTPGSFVEERNASLVWRFWTENFKVEPPSPKTPESADPSADMQKSAGDRQWAWRQAAEAQNHIFDSLGETYGLRIIPGKDSFLVLPNNISRSTAVGLILHSGEVLTGSEKKVKELQNDSEGGERRLEFLLAISGDEMLLRRLNELDIAETCSTSGRGTDAKWKLPSQGGENAEVVLDVLRYLMKETEGTEI